MKYLIAICIIAISLTGCTTTQLKADGKAILKTAEGTAVAIAQKELQAYIESLVTK